MRPLVRAEGISKSYGPAHILEGASFVVHPGDKIALVGPNGSGKTTLFKLLAGQLKAHSATAELQEQRIWLLSFHRWTPAQQRLVEVLARCCEEVQQVWEERNSPDVQVLRMPDFSVELQHMAGWAREQLAADPTKSLAIVVPDLAAVRAEVCQVLDEQLRPQAEAPGAPAPLGWPGSAQPSLDQEPVIRTALQILVTPDSGEDNATLMRLLLSPFIQAGNADTSHAVETDRMLREKGITPCGLEQAAAARPHPVFRAVLKARAGLARCRAQRWADWAREFSRALRTAGWLRGVSLTTREAVAVQRWSEALDQLAGLDRVSAPVPLQAALRELQRVLAGTTGCGDRAQAPIQLLTPAEAIGQQFDGVWLLNMHDGVWPPVVRPNAYIPYRLQREHGLPGADPVADSAEAQALTRGLLQIAPAVLVSFPERSGDQPLGASPLLRSCPVAEQMPQTASSEGWRTLQQQSAPRLESFVDDQAPALPPGHYRGGSGILEKQACCPFRAFAETRLRAAELGATEPGLDARTRGIVAHEALEVFWEETGDSATLLALQEDALLARVQACVERALEVIEEKRGAPFAPGFRALESARLRELVLAHLAVERERGAFSVRAVESMREVTVGGLGCQIKLDRVDQLSDGGLAVIDYKTGAVSKSRWNGERLEAPQLPLYTLALEKPPEAIAFMRLKRGEIGYDGVSAKAGQLPAVVAWDGRYSAFRHFPSWRALLDHWQQALETIAVEYLGGVAPVLPVSRQRNCAHCALTALCRIQENPVERSSVTEADA